MKLTLDPILRSAGINPLLAPVLRHAFVKAREDNGL